MRPESRKARSERFIRFCRLLPAMYRRRPSKHDLDRIRRACVGKNLIDIDCLEQFAEKAIEICIAFATLFPEEIETFDEPWRAQFKALAERA